MTTSKPEADPYWLARKDLLYYHVVKVLVNGLGEEIESILDVGSAGCPYLDWFPRIPIKVSLDREIPYSGPGIMPVRSDFLDWQANQIFDIVTCLQVMEHVARVDVFAQKLLSVGKIVIVSVPYKWPPDPAGAHGSHVHDPVDEKKMSLWFGREPNFQYVCREPTGHSRRLIHVYERHGSRWRNLKQRNRKRAAGWPRDFETPVSFVPSEPDESSLRSRGAAAVRSRIWLSSFLRRIAARIDPAAVKARRLPD